jgi:hypothetical protein
MDVLQAIGATLVLAPRAQSYGMIMRRQEAYAL